MKIFVIGTWKNPYRFVRRDESVYSLTVVEFMTGNFTQYGIEFFWKRLKKDDGNQKKETVQEQEWRGQERLPEIPRGSGRGGHLLRDVPTAVADQWCWSVGVSVGGI